MKDFSKEFKALRFAIKESDRILLFAHTRPDGDTIGAALTLREHILSLGKIADIACFDPFPEFLKDFSPDYFNFPDRVDLRSYKTVIAADSVERGFSNVKEKFSDSQVTVLIDHHPDLKISGDINLTDPQYSSVCEIIYDYMTYVNAPISNRMAAYLMLGILWDTGIFQHANTSPRVMKIASELMKKGAPIPKIVNMVFTNKKINTLKLWGKAFAKAKINPDTGMIVSVLTQNDLDECQAGTEDIAQVAAILNTVPGTKFALILSQRDGNIKGSLRSDEYKDVDVSKIAAQFGGGGHKLASGFEMKGTIIETENGWKIV